MAKLIYIFLLVTVFFSQTYSQFSQDFKLKEHKDQFGLISGKLIKDNTGSDENLTQIKTRKAMHMYFGAGYSFVIFTNGVMNTGYPVLDTRSGDFLSEVNLYFGIAIASALTIELEPSILFTRNNRSDRLDLTTPVNYSGTSYNFDYPYYQGMTAFPIASECQVFSVLCSEKLYQVVFYRSRCRCSICS